LQSACPGAQTGGVLLDAVAVELADGDSEGAAEAAVDGTLGVPLGRLLGAELGRALTDAKGPDAAADPEEAALEAGGSVRTPASMF
jgi:hypothetical protein